MDLFGIRTIFDELCIHCPIRYLDKDQMMWNKIRNKAYIIIALITVLIFFYPLFFAEQTFFFRDIQSIFYPMKYFLAQSLRSGAIPFWCPLYFCGAPFMSDIQTGVFYPPSIIFFILSYPLSFNIYVVFHVFLCFCFAYLFVRGIGLITYNIFRTF